MRNFSVIPVIAVVLMITSAGAVTVNVDGREWEAVPDGNGGTNYTINDDGLTLTGNWQRWIHAYTEISVGAGSIIAFDLELTKRDGGWIGDAGWYLLDNMTDWTNAQRIMWFNDISVVYDNLYNQSAEVAAGEGNIIHVLIEFPTESDYIVTLNNGEQSTTFANPIYAAGMTAGDIKTFQFWSWDTLQDITISNFYAGPSPVAWGANPGNGSANIGLDSDLSWNEPGGYVPLGYYVYLRAGEPNFADAAGNILDGVSVEPVETDPVTLEIDTLDFNTTYFWRVDTIDPNDPNETGAGAAILYEGFVWSFTTVGASPVIDRFDNIRTSLELLDADITAMVSDADNNLSGAVWELVSDDYRYPVGANASVTDTTTDNYAPTGVFSTDTAGTYIVRLTASDADGNVSEAMAEIQVAQTACDAAQLLPTWTGFDPFDADEDCDIDIEDFAAFAERWLDYQGLSEQDVWSGAFSYLPGHGIPNGGFELGSLEGWTSAPWNTSEITDAAGDVKEGKYASSLYYANAGVTTGVFELPAGSHSITFWYKGDLNRLRCGFDGGMTTAAYTITTELIGGDTIFEGAVTEYTQFSVEFDVTEAGSGGFFIWGNDGGTGTGFVDDVRLNL